MHINTLELLHTSSKYILWIFLTVPFFCSAQIEKNNNEYTKLDTLIEVYKLLQKDNKIQVYRIQVDSHESLEKTQANQEKYIKMFPLKTSEIIFEAPEYKLITSVHIDKKNAEKELQKIKKKFKNSFLFQQEITMNKFRESMKN